MIALPRGAACVQSPSFEWADIYYTLKGTLEGAAGLDQVATSTVQAEALEQTKGPTLQAQPILVEQTPL